MNPLPPAPARPFALEEALSNGGSFTIRHDQLMRDTSVIGRPQVIGKSGTVRSLDQRHCGEAKEDAMAVLPSPLRGVADVLPAITAEELQWANTAYDEWEKQ